MTHLLILSLLFASAGTVQASPPNQITVDAEQVIGQINPNIYGHFIEHIGRCIYEGVWTDNPEVPSVYGGIRKDVVELVKQIKPPIIRYPGGCFSDTYHWLDGIGPRKSRPEKENLAWKAFGPEIGPVDNNHFGTDEFIQFVCLVGAEPYLNVNFGSGTPEEAAAWVAYCNAAKDNNTVIGMDEEGFDWQTAGFWAKKRTENGHPEPYGVKYWGIGNEIYGFWETGFTQPEKYAEGFKKFHLLMKKVDPTIKLIAVGAPSNYAKWNPRVLRFAGEYMDYLSIHLYVPALEYAIKMTNSEEHYYSVVAAPLVVEKELLQVGSVIKEWQESLEEKHEILIAFDEWNVHWAHKQFREWNYSLRDGLFVAGVLNLLQRLAISNRVGMANLAQLINVIGAIITSETDAYGSPLWLVFKLYRDQAGELLVKSATTSEKFECEKLGNIPEMEEVPCLDCSATLDKAKKKLNLIVINRHFSAALPTQIYIKNFLVKEGEIYELNGPSPASVNDFENKEVVKIAKKDISISGSQFVYTFPAHSVTALVFATENTIRE